MTPKRILIVGGSLAGLRAAQTLRSEGFAGRLTILGAEAHMPYDRPPLSKELLGGAVDADGIRLPLPEGLGAEWILREPAAQLDLDRRTVVTTTGRELGFDGLVIATGSVPRRLAPLDPGLARVHELRTLDDALELRGALGSQPRIVLVGCGFIGVEVASAARACGSDVAIVSLDPPLVLAGEIISQACTRLLEDSGAALHLGRSVAALEGEAAVEAVVLDDGSRLAADLVVVAVGARPMTDWLGGSGLTLDDGVLCDASCAAVGADGVVAAGDVARWPNLRFGGLPMRIEHWTNAVEQGAAAARTLLHGAGGQTAYAPVPSFWSDHFGTRLQTVGLPLLADRSVIVDGSFEQQHFVVAGYLGEELVAAATYGMVRGLTPYRIKLARSGSPLALARSM